MRSNLKYENCNHSTDKYFEGLFVKEDYCDNCLDEIAVIESQRT